MKNTENALDKARLEHLSQACKLIRTPPIGYKWSVKHGVRTIVVDEQYAPVVRHIFSLYAGGNYSLEQIREELIDTFSIIKTRESLRRIIKNNFYRGYIDTKGGLHVHAFDRFVPPFLWDEANKILKRYRSKNRKIKAQRIDILYRKCLTCAACNYRVSGERKKGTYVYYRCSNINDGQHNKNYMNETVITEEITSILKDLAVDVDMISFDNDTMVKLFKILFVYFTVDGNNLIYKLHPDIDAIDIEAYLNNRPVIKGRSNRVKKALKQHESGDPFLAFCTTPRTVDELVEQFNMSLEEVQNRLFDYQLNDQLQEDETGKWKRI